MKTSEQSVVANDIRAMSEADIRAELADRDAHPESFEHLLELRDAAQAQLSAYVSRGHALSSALVTILQSRSKGSAE